MEVGGDPPQPMCPSPYLAQLLKIDQEILNSPRDVMKYAHRLPVIPRCHALEGTTHPIVRQNWLLYLRMEELPHPAIMFREVVRREPYMFGNTALKRWIFDMMIGIAIPRDKTKPNHETNRCSYCGSSFLGYPLYNHSFEECGFYLYLRKEELLEFMIANTHAFCGYCNSRSAWHTGCDSKKNVCQNCRRLGHKVYHGVCYTEYGATPEAFKQRTRFLRIERAKRIQWLAKEGYLAFPLPTDSVPETIIIENLRLSLPIRGTGPLIGDDVADYYNVPEDLYRKEVGYPGLVSVELSHNQLNNQISLTYDAIAWFQLLENRSREWYTHRDEQLHPSVLVKLTYDLPFPVLPVGMRQPGTPLNNGAAVPRPLRAPNANVGIPRDARIPQAANRLAEDAINDGDNWEPVDQAAIDELAVVRNRALELMRPIDMSIETAIKDAIPDEDVGATVRAIVAANREPRSLELGAEASAGEILQERELKAVMAQYVKNTAVRIKGKIFVCGVQKPLIDAFRSVELPAGYTTLLCRVTTWQCILTGEWDDNMGKPSKARVIEYCKYLIGIADSLSRFHGTFTRLQFDANQTAEDVIHGIPTIAFFDDPEKVKEMNAWLRAEDGKHVVFNANKTEFPFNQESRKTVTVPEREEVEHDVEMGLCAVIEAFNKPRALLSLGHIVPCCEILEQVITRSIPYYNSNVITHIRTIQRAMTGTCESWKSLDGLPDEFIRAYADQFKIMTSVIHCAARVGILTPIRLSSCLQELTQGSSTSLEVILPTAYIFSHETNEWWLGWIKVIFIPLMERLSGHICKCRDHSLKMN